ncbi:MAG: hypothetical protein ACWA5A_01250 [Marinibacterium sp.]
MGKLLIVALLVLASPVWAQNKEPECRGKTYLKLSGGVYGCLVDVTPGALKRTTRWDNGASKSRRLDAALVKVLLFGPYESSKSLIKSRTQSICRAFKSGIAKEMNEAKYSYVSVAMIWPRQVRTTNKAGNQVVSVQVGYSTPQCRGAGILFG